jgi:hypothetical protein
VPAAGAPVAADSAQADQQFSLVPPSSKREPESIPNFDDDTAVGTSDMLAAASAEGRGAEQESTGVDPDLDLIEAEADLGDPESDIGDLVEAELASELSSGESERVAAVESIAEPGVLAQAGLADARADAELGEDRESGLIEVELDEAEGSDAVLLEDEDTDIRRSGTFANDTWGAPAPAFELPTDPLRVSEADGYNKLVSTFLRTEFDSTRRRVARRLDAARKSADATSKQLAERALERVRDAGQVQAFEAALTD